MIYLTFILTFAATVLLSYLLRYLLESWQILDFPNHRSSHTEPLPRGGGLAICVVFLVALFVTGFYQSLDSDFVTAIFIGSPIIALIGLSDDIFNPNVFIRFVAMLIVIAFCVWQLGIPAVPFGTFMLSSTFLLFPIAVLFLLWLVNLFNFMDGIDAIASVEAISVALIAALLLVVLASEYDLAKVLVLMACAVAGFLVLNWPPAKIFMGDVASGFLGFVLGLFAIKTSVQETMNVWVWLILLGLFFIDATVTIIKRIINREKFYQAHRQHAYQRIALYLQKTKKRDLRTARKYAHQTVSLGVVGINFLWLAPFALLAGLYPEWGIVYAFIALTPLVILVLHSANIGETT